VTLSLYSLLSQPVCLFIIIVYSLFLCCYYGFRTDTNKESKNDACWVFVVFPESWNKYDKPACEEVTASTTIVCPVSVWEELLYKASQSVKVNRHTGDCWSNLTLIARIGVWEPLHQTCFPYIPDPIAKICLPKYSCTNDPHGFSVYTFIC